MGTANSMFLGLADLQECRTAWSWAVIQGFDGIEKRKHPMLRLAIAFLVIALIAAVLGFGGIAGASVGIAKIVFIIFIVLFVIGAIAHLMRKT
jgi:uncharacterized membrane protein YtjA (UPF0391 family)